MSIARTTSPLDGFSARPLYILLLLAAIAWLVFSYGYVEDDAFIHLEFARSLAEGHGFSFNGQLTNGDTSPLWVLLLAAIHSVGLDWIDTAKLLCGIGVVSALAGAWRIARDLDDSTRRHKYLAPSVVLITAVNPYFVHWSFSGMESAAALGLSLWIVWAAGHTDGVDWARTLIAMLLVAVAPLLRPELLLLGAIAGPLLLYQAWRLCASSHISRRYGVVIALALVMALPMLLWADYAWHSFGSIMPNTNSAKRLASLTTVGTKLVSVYALGFAMTIATVPFVAKRLVKPGLPRTIWLLLAWPLACIAFYLMNHTAVQTRYSLVSMPSLTIATLWLLEDSVRPALVRCIIGTTLAFSVAVLVLIVWPDVGNKIKLVKTVSGAAAYIRDKLPMDAPVAVFSIGQLAFESRHPLIDIGGITRPGVLPYVSDLSASIRWSEGQGAKFYIGGAPPIPGAERLFSYPEPFTGWSFRRSNYNTSTYTGIYRLPQ